MEMYKPKGWAGHRRNAANILRTLPRRPIFTHPNLVLVFINVFFFKFY